MSLLSQIIVDIPKYLRISRGLEQIRIISTSIISLKKSPLRNKKIEEKKIENNENKTKSENQLSEGEAYHNLRKYHIEQCQKNQESVYPHKFSISTTVSKFIANYSYLKNEETVQESQYIAGRIHSIRRASKNLIFFDIIGDGNKIQIKAEVNKYKNKEKFVQNMNQIHRGDIIGVTGDPLRTKRGELSISATNTQILAPCLRLLPTLFTGINNQETKFRKRYLDLMINPDSRCKFILRNKIMMYLRNFLNDLDFMEVETPILDSHIGGASAKPFCTRHNDLNLDLYLRVAPELYLKKLIIGGFDRIYEIGKQFRNEGLDADHNPEFTSCEFYMAYSDYSDVLKISEDLISGLVLSINGSYKLNYNPKSSSDDDSWEIDFTPPFNKMDLLTELEHYLKVKLPHPNKLNSDNSRTLLGKLCEEHNIQCQNPQTSSRLLSKLVEHFLEDKCIQPTFIMNYPKFMSPLAKDHRSIPGLTERFELFIATKEICNAYTELNDPVEQRDRFSQQGKDRDDGDEEAQVLNEEFCAALEYGLPPTAGWGMGIDRLAMILSNSSSIRDVLLFPMMRPVQTSEDKDV